jgi:hypothetical protein
MTNRYDTAYSSTNQPTRLYMTADTEIRGEIEGLRQNTNQHGRSLILRIPDAEVLEGVIMKKTDGTDSLKLFPWEKFGFSRTESGIPDPTTGNIPDIHTREVGNTQYVYEHVGSAYQTDDEEKFTQLTEQIGDVSMFLNGGSRGRTLAELVCEKGQEARNTGRYWDHDVKWLKENVAELRGTMRDRQIRISFKKEESRNGNEYDQAVVVDDETGARIRVPEPQTTSMSAE